jgi:hypothetical protein
MIEYWIKHTAFSSNLKKVVFIFPAVGMFTVTPRKALRVYLNPSSTKVDSISVLARMRQLSKAIKYHTLTGNLNPG